MNTKVKVGIASVIVAALVALIVLDQKTTPKPETPGESAGGIVAPPPSSPNERVSLMREEEINNLIKKAKELGAERAPEPKTSPSIKNPEPPAGGKEPSSTPKTEEWVIEQGQTLESIAEAKYGSRSFVGLITQANPDVKPNALRVGKKLVLPPKPEKKAEEAVAGPKATPGGESPVAVVNNQKVYTVQPGDTLSGISTKVYNTSRHVEKIYEANRDRIADPSTLYVGTKLVMPDLPVKPAAGAAPSNTVATAAAAPASGKTHAVQQGESLWKIAEKYAGEKGVGILEMIQTLIQANPDKLKDEKTMLRLGWQLIVPE
jgi:nucleoid-associated protein YgaU